MTRFIDSLADVAGDYDAIVLDQWGVLHNGKTPYPSAVSCLEGLYTAGARLAVLSNSGKRSDLNAQRIQQMGFPAHLFEIVMTSGEALYRDVETGRISERAFFAIEGAMGDAARWATGLDLTFVDDPDLAEAVLIMGLPDGASSAEYQSVLDAARRKRVPVYCSNPDRTSPRGAGYVMSPGALAHDYADKGGAVRFYGKPHLPVYEALNAALGTSKLLMIGDSLEHDIAGANAAGWDSLFIRGGIHAPHFAGFHPETVLDELAAKDGAVPTYSLEVLQ